MKITDSTKRLDLHEKLIHSTRADLIPVFKKIGTLKADVKKANSTAKCALEAVRIVNEAASGAMKAADQNFMEVDERLNSLNNMYVHKSSNNLTQNRRATTYKQVGIIAGVSAIFAIITTALLLKGVK